MEILDPAAEWRRLSAHYRQLTDDELVDLARKQGELTDIAQQCLRDEVGGRGLKIEPVKTKKARPVLVPQSPDSPYAEERSLVQLCTVWSMRDALQIQTLLDRAGIPFYIGEERATGVDEVTSNFSEGVDISIMSVGLPWARPLMLDYFPKDVPAAEKEEEEKTESRAVIRCPKCNSEEVVFQDMQDEDPAAHERIVQKYKWKCDSCGNEWEDDGIAK